MVLLKNIKKIKIVFENYQNWKKYKFLDFFKKKFWIPWSYIFSILIGQVFHRIYWFSFTRVDHSFAAWINLSIWILTAVRAGLFHWPLIIRPPARQEKIRWTPSEIGSGRPADSSAFCTNSWIFQSERMFQVGTRSVISRIIRATAVQFWTFCAQTWYHFARRSSASARMHWSVGMYSIVGSSGSAKEYFYWKFSVFQP